jgi:hypothetical protein
LTRTLSLAFKDKEKSEAVEEADKGTFLQEVLISIPRVM